MKQISFARLAEAGKKRKTKRERFLEEMETVVPWPALVALIEPHYPKAGKGRRPRGLETMLRIYFMQQWFNLSDPGMEDALYDVACMRAFARLELFDESMPDETTILKFRRLLEKHQLTAAIMNAINDTLEQKGLLLKGGTMVDATIIHAPPSTKNEAKQRDPEMRQTKKGNQWCVSRTQAADLWCCTEDGSRPPEAGLQEQASNHPVLLRSKDVVVSDRAKVIP